MADRIGQQIGNYRLIGELASGGFGSVYVAHHIILAERTVAIKLLHAYFASMDDREHFLQEARFLERLKHPHILPIIDVGISDNLPYLVIEYSSGGSLRDRLKGASPHLLPQTVSLTIFSQIGQALQYAHQQNVIHRDLKPENILFNSKGEALLADFGLATMLATTSLKQVTAIGGTPAYMAPEQFQGALSKESDQYALGCIAYELFTGRQPFFATNILALGFKHATEEPLAPSQLNPDLPPSIEQAILKALAKQRMDRYKDIAAFVAALTAPLQSQATISLRTQEEHVPAEQAAPFSTVLQTDTVEPGLPAQSFPSGRPVDPSLALPLPPLPSAEDISAQGRGMETAQSHSAKKGRVSEPQSQTPLLPADGREAWQVWSVRRQQLLTMVLGVMLYGIIIFGGEGLLKISLTRGSWFYPSTGYLSSIVLWCLLVTLACYFGAKFGPWVGLVTGGVGYFLAAYISWVSIAGTSLTFGQYLSFYYFTGSSFDITGYPILTSYFNLSLALLGFVAGLALLKTQGRYSTLRLVAIAEGFSLLGAVLTGVVVFLLLLGWRGLTEVGILSEVSLKLLLYTIPTLILLPLLLIVSDRVTELRRRSDRERNRDRLP